MSAPRFTKSNMSIFLTLRSRYFRYEYAARLSFKWLGRVRPIGGIAVAVPAKASGPAVAASAACTRKPRRVVGCMMIILAMANEAEGDSRPSALLGRRLLSRASMANRRDERHPRAPKRMRNAGKHVRKNDGLVHGALTESESAGRRSRSVASQRRVFLTHRVRKLSLSNSRNAVWRRGTRLRSSSGMMAWMSAVTTLETKRMLAF